MDLNSKINRMREEGQDSILFISDFDGTLTMGFDFDGKRAINTANVFRKKKFLGPEYDRVAAGLVSYYAKIENDYAMSYKKRSEKMLDWWIKQYDAMEEFGLNKRVIKKVVEEDDIKVRDYFDDFFYFLNSKRIPIIVMSAGVGDIIKEFLKYRGKLRNNVHIISNFFKYDSQGFFNGVKNDIIHPMNKYAIPIHKSKFYDKIKGRKNIILLGDSIGDLKMNEGLEHHNIIRIGFYRDTGDKEMRKKYEELFDVLIENNDDLRPVISLIREITNQG